MKMKRPLSLSDTERVWLILLCIFTCFFTALELITLRSVSVDLGKSAFALVYLYWLFHTLFFLFVLACQQPHNDSTHLTQNSANHRHSLCALSPRFCLAADVDMEDSSSVLSPRMALSAFGESVVLVTLTSATSLSSGRALPGALLVLALYCPRLSELWSVSCMCLRHPSRVRHNAGGIVAICVLFGGMVFAMLSLASGNSGGSHSTVEGEMHGDKKWYALAALLAAVSLSGGHWRLRGHSLAMAVTNASGTQRTNSRPFANGCANESRHCGCLRCKLKHSVLALLFSAVVCPVAYFALVANATGDGRSIEAMWAHLSGGLVGPLLHKPTTLARFTLCIAASLSSAICHSLFFTWHLESSHLIAARAKKKTTANGSVAPDSIAQLYYSDFRTPTNPPLFDANFRGQYFVGDSTVGNGMNRIGAYGDGHYSSRSGMTTSGRLLDEDQLREARIERWLYIQQLGASETALSILWQVSMIGATLCCFVVYSLNSCHRHGDGGATLWWCIPRGKDDEKSPSNGQFDLVLFGAVLCVAIGTVIRLGDFDSTRTERVFALDIEMIASRSKRTGLSAANEKKRKRSLWKKTQSKSVSEIGSDKIDSRFLPMEDSSGRRRAKSLSRTEQRHSQRGGILKSIRQKIGFGGAESGRHSRRKRGEATRIRSHSVEQFEGDEFFVDANDGDDMFDVLLATSVTPVICGREDAVAGEWGDEWRHGDAEPGAVRKHGSRARHSQSQNWQTEEGTAEKGFVADRRQRRSHSMHDLRHGAYDYYAHAHGGDASVEPFEAGTGHYRVEDAHLFETERRMRVAKNGSGRIRSASISERRLKRGAKAERLFEGVGESHPGSEFVVDANEGYAAAVFNDTGDTCVSAFAYSDPLKEGLGEAPEMVKHSTR